jgi:hypothetical protein
MALLKNIETEFGININGAYLCIESFQYQKGERVNVVIACYVNREARDNGSKLIQRVYFGFNYNHILNENIIEQAYLEIKLNPDFSDATDA